MQEAMQAEKEAMQAMQAEKEAMQVEKEAMENEQLVAMEDVIKQVQIADALPNSH
jgi:hypothetical protein